MNVVAVIMGLGLVGWVLKDTFETLLATNLKAGRFSLTRAYYRALWRTYRGICVRLKSERTREKWLGVFGPASFLGLLIVWVLLEIFAWGLVWWGLRDGFGTELSSFADAWYYAGVVYFSVGFGDILPATGLLRFLTILGALSGLGTLGLVIGFLPTLNSAYSAREKQLLLLDDLSDDRITPVSMISAQVGPNRDMARLEEMFDEWATWCGEVYDTHTSLPMLMWFRSKHRGNSWITGLGVITDAATAYIAAVPGSEYGAAMRLHRQADRMMNGLGALVGIEPKADLGPIPEHWWRIAYDDLAASGLELREFNESLDLLVELRYKVQPMIEAFIDELLTPRGFWGVTAADHLAPSETLLDEVEDFGG